nr:hypothetical protein [Tanacetum cinerariifolium]
MSTTADIKDKRYQLNTSSLQERRKMHWPFLLSERLKADSTVRVNRNDPLNTQVTALVDEHLDSRLGAIRDEFMSYLSASITARITEQVKSQLCQTLQKELSNFAPLMIKSIITESLEHAVLAKESSQPKSTYEAVATLTEFELMKFFIDKMDESQSYLTATKHRECYDGLIKSYDLDKNPSAGSDRGLKKRKTNKDAEPTKEELEFKVVDSDMPQDQEENLGNDEEEPMGKVASKRDWFTKPKQPQEPTDPDWNVGKTPQQGPTQSRLMTLASSADKLSKTFDELISTPIDFSAYIMNDLKITNLTQEPLLGPAFKLLKSTRFNYAKLEYDFEECYKDLSEKLDWDNPKGGDYPFDLTKPLPLVMNGNHQMVPVKYFFNSDLKYARGLESTHDVYSTKCILEVTRVEVMRKHSTANVHQKHGYSKESQRSSAGSRKLPEKDQRRNRLMCSDELYKFSDGTLTRLRTLLDDITKNIRMEYLP